MSCTGDPQNLLSWKALTSNRPPKCTSLLHLPVRKATAGPEVTTGAVSCSVDISMSSSPRWSLPPTASMLRKRCTALAQCWRGAGTSEASREGEDNHGAAIALRVHGEARICSASSPPPVTSIHRDGTRSAPPEGLFSLSATCACYSW